MTLKMIEGGKGQETDGSLALKRSDFTPGDKASHMAIERGENGYVLRVQYPEGDHRVLVFGAHMGNELLEEVKNRL
jgi:hypothetical protein